jgi:hypothetical protein
LLKPNVNNLFCVKKPILGEKYQGWFRISFGEFGSNVTQNEEIVYLVIQD